MADLSPEVKSWGENMARAILAGRADWEKYQDRPYADLIVAAIREAADDEEHGANRLAHLIGSLAFLGFQLASYIAKAMDVEPMDVIKSLFEGIDQAGFIYKGRYVYKDE